MTQLPRHLFLLEGNCSTGGLRAQGKNSLPQAAPLLLPLV